MTQHKINDKKQTVSHFIKSCFPFIAAEGWPIIGVFSLTAAIFYASHWLISSQTSPFLKQIAAICTGISVCLVLFSVWFFRDPDRIPESQNIKSVISSADGTVLKTETVNDARYGGMAEKVSIFMSPFNVHVNRAAVSGVIEKIEYFPGKFFSANLDKASEENERNLIIIKTPQGQKVGLLQIAGFIARRIVCRVKTGSPLRAGERYGMIRFGSRMEIFLPPGSKIFVKSNKKVYAGKTVIGELL
ncbi:MAG: phosphatidylserine decarboxylase family protein [Bdellovibrio sp.]|nr:phosphatidylserine decarboxylase family protein [Bdellovibrio sp.]